MLIILWRLILCWFIVDFGLDAFNYVFFDVEITAGAALSACIVSSLSFFEMLLSSILRQHINESNQDEMD